MVNKACIKLYAKYFPPYKIIAKVGEVAYKLQLPLEAKIHLVFHVFSVEETCGKDAHTILIAYGRC